MAKGPYTDSKGKYVIVEYSDTLSEICEDFLGSGSKTTYMKVATLNGISDPDKIYVGDKIYLDSAGTTVNNNGSKYAVTNLRLGILANSTADNELTATWDWSRESRTKHYKIAWSYDLGDGVEREGSIGENSLDEEKELWKFARQSKYTIPTGACKVYFKVKPVSKDKKEVGTNHFNGTWAKAEYSIDEPLATPTNAPSVEIDDKCQLTATLDSVDVNGADSVIFGIVKDNDTKNYNTSSPIRLKLGYATYSCTVLPGSEYKVRYRLYSTKTQKKSPWGPFSENKKTVPAAPSGFKSIKVTSESSIRLEWAESKTAETYEIEYSTERDYFDNTDQTLNKGEIKNTYFEFIGLESGKQYYFRVRATNTEGSSPWTAISDPVIIGEAPDAPTTWSSTTTAIVGEPVTLYWVHNSLDGSSQTYAELEFTVNGVLQKPTILIKNTTNEDEKDKTSSCILNTTTGYIHWTDDDGDQSAYIGVEIAEGSKIEWRVRTAGIALNTEDGGYGDWSTMRTIDVYAQPTLEMTVKGYNGELINDLSDAPLTSFPFYVNALAGPATQAPIGFHVAVTSNQVYDTVDNLGNPRIVNVGELLYSKYFDSNLKETKLVYYKVKYDDTQQEYLQTDEVLSYIYGDIVDNAVTVGGMQVYHTTVTGDNGELEDLYFCKVYESSNVTIGELMVEFTPANIDLENSMSYTVTCTVSMDSGLTAEASSTFTVSWEEITYEPNAEIGIDQENMTATIKPYCNESWLAYYKVENIDGTYTKTDEDLGFVSGEVIEGAYTADGEEVYYGVTAAGDEVNFCKMYETKPITEVLLSVYRREYDGKFTELGTGLDSAKNTAITDPHPALDYARYRIVATSKTTGAVSYSDLPGHPVGCTAIIIQWDEEWTNFDLTDDAVPEQPGWAGSLLKLPYDVDVSENTSPDVSFVEYVGREHPVSYYGTQLGESASWSTSVPKSDKETIYALRRLAKWTDNVYVREPSGVGYWANITVNFNQKHCDMVVPVTFNIKRVEGGA